MLNTLKTLTLAAALGGGLTAAASHPATAAPATDYPNKAIRFIVPFPAGGPADILARLIGKEMSEHFKHAVIVENAPGAGGNIGTAKAASAPADGYTMLMGFVGTHAINTTLYKNLSFDPIRDFTAVAPISTVTIALVAHPSVGVSSVKGLIEKAKAAPGTLSFASPGSGTPHHLAGEMFKSTAGIDMMHVPYKGAVPALTDLIGGRISVMFTSVPPALAHIKDGKLNALAVTSASRAAIDPSWPTMIEEGLPGFEVENWYGVFVPAGTPQPIVETLNAELGRIMRQPAVLEALRVQGAEAMQGSSADFTAYVKSENEKWAKIIRQSGASVD